MEAYQDKKPSLLTKIKGEIKQRVDEEISLQRERRATYKEARHSAEIAAIKAQARQDVADKRGVMFTKKGYAVINPSAKPTRMMDRLNGTAEERAAARKKLFGV